MKKLCIALAILAVTFGAQAQTLPNAGFESWRINSAGGTNPQIVMAPVRWYGADSLIITYGQFFGAALSIPDTVWKAQLFMDSLNVHTGKYSAKMVTKDEDTAGIVSGLMSNAKANVAISLSGFGGISYSGGTAVTQKPLTVSAWVKYVPTDLRDSAFISVQSIAKVAGKDSVVGDVTYRFGGVDAAFRQVTATVEYQPLLAHVDTVRITFGSSFSTRAAAVNSTLYVDDVTMTGEDQAVPLQDMVGNGIWVYPNPATRTLEFEAVQQNQYNGTLYNALGMQVSTFTFTDKTVVDVTALPAGTYYYAIKAGNEKGVTGTVAIVR